MVYFPSLSDEILPHMDRGVVAIIYPESIEVLGHQLHVLLHVSPQLWRVSFAISVPKLYQVSPEVDFPSQEVELFGMDHIFHGTSVPTDPSIVQRIQIVFDFAKASFDKGLVLPKLLFFDQVSNLDLLYNAVGYILGYPSLNFVSPFLVDIVSGVHQIVLFVFDARCCPVSL